MYNNVKERSKSRKFVNWVTVWAFIFACIAFNLYIDNRQTLVKKNQYRAQYEAESQRADSLYRETIRLEQHLQKMQTSTVQRTSTRPVDQPDKFLITSEL